MGNQGWGHLVAGALTGLDLGVPVLGVFFFFMGLFFGMVGALSSRAMRSLSQALRTRSWSTPFRA
jgi:hypothetical protein